MIKKIAWETFKNTGDLNTFLELKQFEGTEAEIYKKNELKDFEIEKIQKDEQNGNDKNKWYNNFSNKFR